MNRRKFCQSILLSPLLSPLFLSLKSVKTGGQLYLIDDSPHLFLPEIIQELEQYTLTGGRSFTILDSSPVERHLRTALLQRGWTHVFSPVRASFNISIDRLQKKVAPSFTLVKQGHVLDIRSKALSSLWARMKASSQPSSLLTTVVFNNQKTLVPPGKKVKVYSEGCVIDEISLCKDTTKTYTNSRGLITVRVEKGKVWIPGASCPHKICCFSPAVSSAGERIICAPNRFFLSVEGPSFIDTAIG